MPAPGSVRGLFFCPSGCLIGCSSRQTRRNRPAPHDCPRSSPVPVLRRSGGSQGHARAAHNIPTMRCKARKGLMARFHVGVGTYCTVAAKRVTRRLRVYQRHSGAPLASHRPVSPPDPPSPSPKTRQNRPDPSAFSRRIRAVFVMFFVRVFVGFLP